MTLFSVSREEKRKVYAESKWCVCCVYVWLFIIFLENSHLVVGLTIETDGVIVRAM